MIIVTVDIKPKAIYKDLFQQEFSMISDKVKKEDGCLEYELFKKNKDSVEFFLFERWESKQALELHLATKHMDAFFKKTADWFVEENQLSVYEVV